MRPLTSTVPTWNEDDLGDDPITIISSQTESTWAWVPIPKGIDPAKSSMDSTSKEALTTTGLERAPKARTRPPWSTNPLFGPPRGV